VEESNNEPKGIQTGDSPFFEPLLPALTSGTF
jgi:hypothetical protein